MATTNPFPGMNPYLEQRWGDVHASLIFLTSDLLQDTLPNDLRARMQERVFIEAAADIRRAVYPDVHVYERPGALPAAASGGVATVAEPLLIRLPDEQVTEGYIEIIDAATGGKVVTVIEFLSPANKVAGAGRQLYIQKQDEIRRSGTNLVEVDLIRAGESTSLTPSFAVPVGKRTPYHVSVYRGANPLMTEYYAAFLRDPLPKISIPLRATDRDVSMELQALLNDCYRRRRYDDIDYHQPLHPPLPAEEAAWADALLHDQGLK